MSPRTNGDSPLKRQLAGFRFLGFHARRELTRHAGRGASTPTSLRRFRMKESGCGIPNGERGRLAWRLARLTPSRAVTLSALRVRANTPGRFPRNHRNYHQFSFARAKSTRVTASPSGEKHVSSTRGSLKFKCQSREDTNTRASGEGQRGAGARECFSRVPRDVENGRRIAPMFALEYCSLGRGSQAPRLSCLRPVLSVLFYSHALPEQTRTV